MWPDDFCPTYILNTLQFSPRAVENIINYFSGICADLSTKNSVRQNLNKRSKAYCLWGRGGITLTPYGYFHPSRLIPAITDNAKRGKLIRDASLGKKAAYCYEFDSNDHLLAIHFREENKTTYCFQDDSFDSFLTYSDQYQQTIEELSIVTHRSGNLEYVITILWTTFDNAHASIERYNWTSSEKVTVDFYQAFTFNSNILFLSQEQYILMYNEAGIIVDWEEGNKEQKIWRDDKAMEEMMKSIF